jgi:DNA replication and repair protein RecF
VRLGKLRTVQWRNIEDGEIEFADGVNVLVGGNGQGKTNVIEAVHYLALGKSHRGARDDELPRFGAEHFFVRGEGDGDAGDAFSIEAGFTPPRSKRIKVDGIAVTRLTDLAGVLACVSFGPEDAELARGAPQLRRRYLDYTLAETSRTSLKALAEYRRVLQQRGALLRGARRGEIESALRVWDDELVTKGLEVTRRRAEALLDLAPRAERAHADLGGSEPLQLQYAVHATGKSFRAGEELARALQDTTALHDAFATRLRERRIAEIARKVCLVGPHRDDIGLVVGERDLRRFGSQGQCRTAAVALKIAQAGFIRAQRRERPVVLLDDVFAELDEKRSRCLWDVVCSEHQTILAVPRQSDLQFGAGDTVFRVDGGRLRREH